MERLERIFFLNRRIIDRDYMPKCPKCGSEGEDYGKNGNGDQVYYCKKCDKTWVPGSVKERVRGALINLDDVDKGGMTSIAVRLVAGIVALVVFYAVAFPILILSMPSYYMAAVGIFFIAWVVSLFLPKLSDMVVLLVVLLAVFIGLALFIGYSGIDVESYIAAYVPDVKPGLCWVEALFTSYGQIQSYIQKEQVGATPFDMAYNSCMNIGVEQKTNWGCGADCLKVSVEGTPISGRPLMLRMVLSADASLPSDLENVKVEVYDGTGAAFTTTACTKENPCTVPKDDTMEFFARVDSASCVGSSYDFNIKASYDYSVYTPKFDVTVYQSRGSAAQKPVSTTETGYGPLKVLFAGSSKYYADELEYSGGAIPVQLRMYYVPGSSSVGVSGEKVSGQKVTIDMLPYTGAPECDEGVVVSSADGKVELDGEFEVGQDFAYSFYPYAFCEFKAPELEGPYKTVGFVGHADYTFSFEKSMITACA